MNNLTLVRRHSYFNFLNNNQYLIKFILEYLELDDVVHLTETCYSLYSMIRNDNYYWYVKYSQKKYKNAPYYYVHSDIHTYLCIGGDNCQHYLDIAYNEYHKIRFNTITSKDMQILLLAKIPDINTITSKDIQILLLAKIPSKSTKYIWNDVNHFNCRFVHWTKTNEQRYPKKYLKDYNLEIDYFDQCRFHDYHKAIKRLTNRNSQNNHSQLERLMN